MSGLRERIVSYTAGNLIAQVISTLAGIYLARTLSLHDLGSFKQVILVVSVTVQLVALGLPLSIFYFLPQFKTQQERVAFAGQTLLLLSSIGAVGALAVFVLSPLIAQRFDNPEISSLLRVGAPLVFTGLVAKYVAPVFLSMDRSRLAGVLRVVQTLSTTAVLVTLVALGMPILYALVGMGIAEGLSVLVGLLLQRRMLPIRPSFNRELFRAQWAYALPLGMSGVVGLLSRQIDQFMVADYFDAATYALYSTGAMEFPLVPLLMSSAAGVILPRLAQLFAEEDRAAYCQLFSRAQLNLAVVLFVILGLVFALAEILLVGLYGEPFERSTWVFRIYVLNSVNRLFLFGVLLQSTGRSRLVLVGEIGFLVLNAIANWFFLRWIGFLGPALATYLAGLVLMAFYTWQLTKVEGLSPRLLYDLPRNLRILFACAVASAATWWVAELLPRNFLFLMVGSGIFMVLVIPLLLVTRGVRRSEIGDLLPWKKS